MQVLLVVMSVVVDSKATKVLCQGSSIKEGTLAGHPVTHGRPQSATA